MAIFIRKYADYNNNWYVFGNTKFLAPATIDRIKNYYSETDNKSFILSYNYAHGTIYTTSFNVMVKGRWK